MPSTPLGFSNSNSTKLTSSPAYPATYSEFGDVDIAFSNPKPSYVAEAFSIFKGISLSTSDSEWGK